mgnify:CR=1 FL=1
MCPLSPKFWYLTRIWVEEIDIYLNLTRTKLSVNPTVLDQARALNIHLRGLFPEQPVQAYAFSNLTRAIGVPAMGYALGSAILIDEKAWDQEEIYMHEFAHIYYALNPDSEELKEIREKALKNKGMLERLRKIIKVKLNINKNKLPLQLRT